MDPNPPGDMAALTRATRLLVTLLTLASVATGAVLHDPWLARLQVGEFRDPDDVALTGDGWPADLLAPLTVDPGWLVGVPAIVSADRLPRGAEQMTWRLALPGLGSAELAERFHHRARANARRIVAMTDPGAAPAATIDDLVAPWGGAAARLRASRLWEAGRWPEAAAACEEILAARDRLGLEASEVLVWTLRHERLRAADGRPVDLERIWSVLDDLGLYDTRSGWAVWLAMRRARELPPLPAGAGEIAGRVLATAGKLWMDGDELAAAGLPRDVEAGLGALLLPRSELGAHFARFPDPPSDGRHQGYWLRGQRRLDSSAGNVERLARLPGLKDGHRLDLWRRASEKRLLRGEWSAGLDDLERGLALMDSEASSGMRRRLREWSVQALALALARDRAGDADRIVAMTEASLRGPARDEFHEDAAALLARLEAPVTPAGGWRTPQEGLVRLGAAPPVNSRDPARLPDPAAWRHQSWRHWADWGLALAREATAPADVAYREGLAAVRAATGQEQRHALGCSVAATRLRGTTLIEPLLRFALHRDVERMSGQRAVPFSSPIDGLRTRGPWTGIDEQLRWHAVLGVALALGDDRGMIAVAVRLPSAGVDDATLLRFWYPVPGDPAVRRALAGSGLPPELLLGIARNESLFEPAIRSRAGALGYMQIMPFHYQEPAAPPGEAHWSHPETSLEAAARILGGEVRASDGDPYRAVAAYNAGRGAVRRWERQLGGTGDPDLFWAWIGYPETRGYTLRVLRDREIYREMFGAAR
ncbi:transglycosylase SLT domain-containing protein [bacterium]|nr:transglycosylase SLT domain-containing protein [bacterium]